MRRLTAVVFCWTVFAAAGEFNSTVSIGDPAPKWENLPGVDGKRYSLSDFADRKLLVVVFTCNSCPYAVDYEDRLNQFHREFVEPGDDVALIAINVNKIDEDLPPAMKKRAEEKGFQFPYLFDESQKIAQEFGAVRTPEFFLLDADRKIVYMGAMDDNSIADKVTKHYLRDALASLRAGEAVKVAETPPVGCAVRYDKPQRKRKAH